jgi:hypothetical protein
LERRLGEAKSTEEKAAFRQRYETAVKARDAALATIDDKYVRAA